jgi:hypothetical protein
VFTAIGINLAGQIVGYGTNGLSQARGFLFNTLFRGTPSGAPLSAALPLFATILTGGGLIAWRRTRKGAEVDA